MNYMANILIDISYPGNFAKIQPLIRTSSVAGTNISSLSNV